MKRGIEILISWLIVETLASIFTPRSIPHNSLEGLIDRVVFFTLPMAAWVYAKHSGRLAPVICYGLIAGMLATWGSFFAFGDSRGMPRDLTLGCQVVIVGVPALITFVCVGLVVLRRYLDKMDD